MSSAPDKATLTAFSKKAEAEIKQHQFAAKTGGLVSLSAPTFWELFYGATAWHEHAAKRKAKGHPPCMLCIGTGKNIMHGHPCENCSGTGRGDVKSAIST